MKTFSTLLITILSLVIIYTATAAVMVPASVSVPDFAAGTSRLVKAVKYNGVYVPVVQLPEVEIIGKRPETVILKGNRTKGSLMVEVNLPVVEIYANRESFQKVPAFLK